MAVRLSAICARSPLLPGRFLVLISVRGWVDTRAIVRLEVLGPLKNPMTSSGTEPTTFQLIAFKSAVNKGLLNNLLLTGYIEITNDYTGRNICT
jgi:hypothetical protein